MSKSKKEQLIELYENLKQCTKCPISPHRCCETNNIVPGRGSVNAKLVLCGEAPGAEEDISSRPFVGQCGKMLDKMLSESDISSREVFLINTVKCLHRNTIVYFSDGTNAKIDYIVNHRINKDVICLDKFGQVTSGRICGWHKNSIEGRKFFKVGYEDCRKSPNGMVGCIVTEDHKILTKDGYKTAIQVNEKDYIATGYKDYSEGQIQLLIGSMLGDGTICKRNNTYSSVHSGKQIEYNKYKAKIFGENVEDVFSNDHYTRCKFSIKANPIIRKLRRNFYKNKKIVPYDIVKNINEFGLAIWYMDDGYSRFHKKGGFKECEIATCGFNKSELIKLQFILKRNFNINTYISKTNRLKFKKSEAYKMYSIISKYIVPSMKYKISPRFRNIKFNSNVYSEDKKCRTYYSKAVKEEYHSNDKTVFCIDVEEHHNFLTQGGIVHNCRPFERGRRGLKNRPPKQEEIKCCKSWLWNELKILQPKVIVTLGMVPTKTLLNINKKSSQLKDYMGQFHEFPHLEDCKIIPCWHPSYVMRSPAKNLPIVVDILKKARGICYD